jgi:hypothetical protein
MLVCKDYAFFQKVYFILISSPSHPAFSFLQSGWWRSSNFYIVITYGRSVWLSSSVALEALSGLGFRDMFS